MQQKVNFADPRFEPTDEQLVQLSKEAFAGIREANELRLKRLRAEIASGRAELLEHLRKRRMQGQK